MLERNWSNNQRYVKNLQKTMNDDDYDRKKICRESMTKKSPKTKNQNYNEIFHWQMVNQMKDIFKKIWYRFYHGVKNRVELKKKLEIARTYKQNENFDENPNSYEKNLVRQFVSLPTNVFRYVVIMQTWVVSLNNEICDTSLFINN